ncbi:TPA: WxL domain-containing protein [Enterococcus faecium]|uniref:WxL domain-containing protein n=1 Tax=Enterococcus faecium TaxID=1352 RepID=A0A7V7GK71_ENTFC|nr:WxL domain-containing protein [Enterococcus faecium]EMF0491748.1 WxL domain-containing protein [Enterococcus faecium]KAA0685936.1 hypothetical protein DTX73_14530 [Enterococcus faecium]MBK5084320.1 WxL domain-containing protein [Enterococcus faecium]MBK5172656.1 WxL domain-containing protein [Enterococcus faecium]NTJ91006.1 WxL domain-containing protein [Enterococcus faecium]
MKKHVTLFSSVLMMSTTLLGSGSVFAASQSTNASPESTDTPVQAVLELPNGGGSNPTPPTPPTKPDQPDPDNPGNKPNNPNGTFGIAYQPDIFNFGTVKLQESGAQVVTATQPKGGTFHVGVKDKTREKQGWTLKAGLTGPLAKQEGVTIEFGTGKVKVNDEGTLKDAPEGTVTGEAKVVAGTTEGLVMTGQSGKIHNNVYDYDLGDVKLKLADAKKVQAANYNGSSVHWHLEKVPNA